MGRVSTCQKNCKTIDLRGAQVNNREAGDLRRHRANYDIIGMASSQITISVYFLSSQIVFWLHRNYALFNERTLRRRHNERDGVSNHQSCDCLLNRLFRRRSKKHKSSASLAFVRGIHRWPVNSPHKGPVTRKRFPFDDVIIKIFSFNDAFVHCCVWVCWAWPCQCWARWSSTGRWLTSPVTSGSVVTGDNQLTVTGNSISTKISWWDWQSNARPTQLVHLCFH